MKLRSTLLGTTALVILLSAGAAQSLAGSNTVFTDDISPGQVYGSDIASNAITGSKIYPNTVTGADVNESTLAIKQIYTTRIRETGVEASGDASSSTLLSGDTYQVRFPTNVSKCSAHATPATFNPIEVNSAVTVGAIGHTFQWSFDDDEVRVQFWNPGEEDWTTTDFNLTLVCPAPAVISPRG